MFGLCLVMWKLILEKYFPHLRVFGATENVGQPEIVFLMTIK